MTQRSTAYLTALGGINEQYSSMAIEMMFELLSYFLILRKIVFFKLAFYSVCEVLCGDEHRSMNR